MEGALEGRKGKICNTLNNKDFKNNKNKKTIHCNLTNCFKPLYELEENQY